MLFYFGSLGIIGVFLVEQNSVFLVSMVSVYYQYFYPISSLYEFIAEKFYEFWSDELVLVKLIYNQDVVYIVDCLYGGYSSFVKFLAL